MFAPSASAFAMCAGEAMRAGGAKRYFSEKDSIKVIQGVEGFVPDKGSLRTFLPYLAQCLRHGLQEIGCRNLLEMHGALADGRLRIERRSASAQREGGVHSLPGYKPPQVPGCF